MSCTKSSGSPVLIEERVCDVCKLVDNDTTVKRCEYCTLCKSWICDPCRPRMERRAMAMYYKLTR